MIIVDTNVISEAVRAGGHPGVEAWLNDRSGPGLHTTAISLAEMLFGIEKLPEGQRKDSLRSDVEAVFARYFADRILAFDSEAAKAYARLVASARSKGLSIAMADGQIAAIARVHGFTVATRDTSPFEAAGIPVIDPWKT